MSSREPTCTAKALRLLVMIAAKRGVRPALVLEPFGVDLASLEDVEKHVPVEWVRRAWTTVPELVGDPDFGLHAAEMAAANPSHVIDYIGAYSRTPREFFEALLRYRRTLNDSSSDFRLELDGDVASLSRHGEAPVHLVACVVAQMLLFVRRRGGGLTLRRATFRRAKPESTSEYERVFQCEVVFGAERDGIELDASALDRELDGADPRLMVFVRRHAEALLAERSTRPPRSDELVREFVLGLQPGATPTLDDAARALGTSARSLQRQLRADGASFKGVVEAVRRDLAIAYLRERQHSVSEVAFFAGFAEVSAFSRAFRRWTGATPLDWRRANASTDA